MILCTAPGAQFHSSKTTTTNLGCFQLFLGILHTLCNGFVNVLLDLLENPVNLVDVFLVAFVQALETVEVILKNNGQLKPKWKRFSKINESICVEIYI